MKNYAIHHNPRSNYQAKVFTFLFTALFACGLHAATNPLGAVLNSNNKVIAFIDGVFNGTDYTGTILASDSVGSSDFYGGSFDWVDFFRSETFQPLGGAAFNNIFKLTPSTGALDQMAGSIAFGVSGQVNALQHSSINDLYIGGKFSSAGGNPYSVNIAVWRASSGWDANSVFSCFNTGSGSSDVIGLSWVGTGTSVKLRVDGHFNYAVTQHPNHQNDSTVYPGTGSPVFLNNTWYSFQFTYWTLN